MIDHTGCPDQRGRSLTLGRSQTLAGRSTTQPSEQGWGGGVLLQQGFTAGCSTRLGGGEVIPRPRPAGRQRISLQARWRPHTHPLRLSRLSTCSSTSPTSSSARRDPVPPAPPVEPLAAGAAAFRLERAVILPAAGASCPDRRLGWLRTLVVATNRTKTGLS